MKRVLAMWVAGAVGFLGTGAEALAERGCDTLRFLPEVRARARTLPIGPALFGGEKLIRDAHGTFPNERASANFAVKWGPDATYADAQVDRMLQGFEQGWSVEIEQMGHPGPGGTDSYRLNVYIGNSGGNAPEIPSYAGGYATLDAEGYPMIVMSPQVMDYFNDPEYATYADGTSVHELYHTIQFGTGAYALGNERGYWYWEATAEWAAAQVFPSHPVAASLLGGFALYPHVSLDFVDYPDEGKLVELHHYGAFVFPQFVSEHIADWSVIRDSWTTAGPDDDPIEVMARLLADRGEDLHDVYARFSAHNATWDYADGVLYAEMVGYYADAYPAEDFRFAATVSRSGSDGFVDAPAQTLPGGLGYNLIRMSNPLSGDLKVALRGDEEGSGNTTAAFRATVVRAFSDRVEYLPMPMSEDGLESELEIDGVGDETAVFLVVAAQPDTWQVGETFSYEYAMEFTDEKSQGFGCATTPGTGSLPAGAIAALLLACIVFRRSVSSARE